MRDADCVHSIPLLLFTGRYGLGTLNEACVALFEPFLSADNLASVLRLAHTHANAPGARRLREVLTSYAATHTASVVEALSLLAIRG